MIRCIDIETSGEEPDVDICEVGWSDIGGNSYNGWVHAGDLYTSHLVNPGRAITPVSSAIHHIIDEDVQSASKVFDVLALAFDTTSETIYAAHYADGDKAAIGNVAASRKWIDTWKVAVTLAPKAPSHSLQALRYWLDLDVDRGLSLAGAPGRPGCLCLRRPAAAHARQDVARGDGAHLGRPDLPAAVLLRQARQGADQRDPDRISRLDPEAAQGRRVVRVRQERHPHLHHRNREAARQPKRIKMAKESFSKRAKRPADECREIMLSDTMTVTPCDGCDCGSVFLKLHRSDGGVFAIAPMSADTADALALDLAQAADKARAAAGQTVRSN